MRSNGALRDVPMVFATCDLPVKHLNCRFVKLAASPNWTMNHLDYAAGQDPAPLLPHDCAAGNESRRLAMQSPPFRVSRSRSLRPLLIHGRGWRASRYSATTGKPYSCGYYPVARDYQTLKLEVFVMLLTFRVSVRLSLADLSLWQAPALQGARCAGETTELGTSLERREVWHVVALGAEVVCA